MYMLDALKLRVFLDGHGIEAVLKNIQSFQDRRQPVDFPIGLSLMGHPSQKGKAKVDGVVECLEKALPIVDFVEINGGQNQRSKTK